MVSYAQLYGASHFHDDENRIKHHPTILAPIYYEVEQEAYSLVPGSSPDVFSPDPEDGRYRYNPSLDAAYFKLLFPFMAKPVALAQMDIYRLLNVDWTYEELEHPGADFVLLAREERGVWQMAALTKGSRGAVFQYSGQLDLAEHLDELAALVQ